LGDSLTEGYGLEPEQAFPAVLEKMLREEGRGDVEVANAGISGSTTASGVGRLKWQLQNRPAIALIALGANDGLRGVSVAQTRKNLADMIKLLKDKGVKVLLAGMKLPPNYGPAYTRAFERMFPELAQENRITLIPFLLEGVAGEKDLNEEDGIHPNEKGHRIIARTVIKYLRPLL
jgi:acyl-CoA thioesterase-1